MIKILVLDDNPAIGGALQTLFSLHGYQVLLAATPAEALTLLASAKPDLLLQDMNFAAGVSDGEQGRALFYQIRQQFPALPIILMTSWTQLSMVVELIKAGAVDYIAKPWDDQRLLLTVANAVRLAQLQQQQQLAQQQQQSLFAGKNLCGLVFASRQMQQLLQMTLQLAPSQAAVLITGPNGAGKEGIASVLHANSSRSKQPFLKLNMGALPAELMEAELFGAEAGAYSGLTKTRVGRFEAADGGTLFLDEIGNLPLAGQIKLLRVLQSGEFERLGSSQTRRVDVRVISATNSDLQQAISRGSFRQDLYYRLNVVELRLPPLKARPDDILPLARHFLAGNKALGADAEQALLHYDWPGNVRELQNVCQRAALLASSEQITAADLGIAAEVSGRKALDDIDQASLLAALEQAGGIVSRAAKQLGLSRQAFYRRLEFYRIKLP